MKIYEADHGEENIGYSQVKAVYPNLPSKHVPTGYVIIDNGIGLASYELSNDN
jgi:hypothetical protein